MDPKLENISNLIKDYGGIDGAHHKQWLLDQILREASVDETSYQAWVQEWNAGEDGPNTYEWDTGIAP